VANDELHRGTGSAAGPGRATAFAGNRKAVMVIYGHDKQANNALFAWLRAIGLQPREWTQLIRATGSGSPFIGEVLDAALRDVQAVVAFFTPDEYVTAAGAGNHQGRFQARPNVLIEAGMALITHPTRTIFAVLGDQELPSDLAGRHYIRLSHHDVGPLNDLAGRLADAGCEIDLSGNDWLDPGQFPDRNGVAPSADEHPASQAPAAETPRAPDLRARQDTEARQVLVSIDAKTGEHFTHLITVSTPITYAIKQVQAQIAWQTNSGLGLTGTGFGGDPPSADHDRRCYTFRASVNPQIRPEPLIRFVDLHGNLYYQFRDHTQRFPADTDWPQAVAAIDEFLRTGPGS
jgi:predicted nucleotide-binding protein